MTTAILFYGHAASNWGDLAINAGATELLRRSGIDLDGSTAVQLFPADRYARRSSMSLKNLRIHSLPVDETPHGGREEIDLLTHYLADPRQFAEDVGLDGYDIAVLNAGEHLFESSAADNSAGLIWRILPALAAAEIGIPVIQLPSTIGPFRTRLGSLVERFLLEGIDAAAFREPESHRLASIGTDKPVLFDPGFFVPGLTFPTHEATTIARLGIVVRPEDIGIRPGSRRSAFVRTRHRESNFRDSQAFRLYATVAEAHLATGGSVTIIVQTQADRELSQALHAHLVDAYGSESVAFADPAGFREFLTELGALDALVTSRFHSVILAMAQGVPSVGVYSETHGHKMPGLFDLMKFPACAIRLDDRDSTVVAAEISAAMDTLVTASAEISNRARAFRSLTRRWFESAVEAAAPVRGDCTQLRIEALGALYRLGLRRVERDALVEIRQRLRRLESSADHTATIAEDLPPAEGLPPAGDRPPAEREPSAQQEPATDRTSVAVTGTDRGDNGAIEEARAERGES